MSIGGFLMRVRISLLLILAFGLRGTAWPQTEVPPEPQPQPQPFKGRTFYVRQTVGDDGKDGLSPQTAWRHFSKLESAMQAGDTAYVGPGLYREEITVSKSGESGKRIVFIADSSGQHTGDPPG